MEIARKTPPDVEELESWKEPAGDRTARIDISGIAVEFEGLPDDLAAAMSSAFAPYFGSATGTGDPLRIRVVTAPIDYFIPPSFAKEWEVYRVLTALENDVFRTVSYRLASWIDVARRCGRVALAWGDRDPAPRAMDNFLRSTVAWLTIDRGGFFLHGASIVRGGRAHLFYGPSGAGKSTLAAMSRDGEVISDDLTPIISEPKGLVAAGGPFRGTYRQGQPLVGTYPVAGFYRLRKDDRTAVRPDDGACFADLVGNLPFVVDQFPRHPEILDRIRARVAGVPFRYLHFRKDEDFWPAIDADREAQ